MATDTVPRSGRVLARVPSALAALFTVIAWSCLILALVPLLRNRSAPVRAVAEYLAIPIRPNLAYAAFLGLIAASLRRRTRVSWWFMVLLYFGPSFVSTLVAGFTRPGLLIGAAVLLVLLGFTFAARREFTAWLPRGSGWRALGALAVGLAVASGLACVLVFALPGTLHSALDKATWAVNHVLGGLGTATSLEIVGRPPRLVTFLCGLFGALAFILATWVLFRPRRAQDLQSAEQETRLRVLLDAAGERDSLGYFATRRDKSVLFSPSGKAAVTYRVVFGTSLASGDPIGDPEAWPPAIDAWLAEARLYAWTPAVLGAGEAAGFAYQRAGLDALQLGDEAVIDVADFDLDGRAMRGVRQARHRIEKAGYTCRIRRHRDIGADDMAAVLARADAWRDTEDERGFSMALGRLGDPADGQCVLVEALDGAGELRAMLSLVPWGTRGLSLDLMRRDRGSDNGLVEFMVVQLVESSRPLGIDRISLNFAMFREVFEEGGRIGAGPVIRLARSVLLFVSRWWQLESLYRANAKYRPAWEPRLLCFRSSRDLARISVAMGIAEGFVSVPSAGALLRRGAKNIHNRQSAPLAPVQPTPVPATPVAARAGPRRDAEAAGRGEDQQARLLALERLRAQGVDPYPPGYPGTSTVAGVRAEHRGLPPDAHTGTEVALTGRVVLTRATGRLCFATIADGPDEIQLMLGADHLPAARLAGWRHDVDPGDQVGVRGEVVTSRRGELSVAVDEWSLTAKCLRPLPYPETTPEPGLSALAPDERNRLRRGGRALAAVRDALSGRDFLEVDPPTSGADLFLRRLVVGGERRVFSVVRGPGRAEGVGTGRARVQAYEAYGDDPSMLVLLRELVRGAAIAVNGAAEDLSGAWPMVSLGGAVGPEPSGTAGSAWYPGIVAGTTGPCWYTDLPIGGAPSDRARPAEPGRAQRYELVASGEVIGAGYAVLVDPIEQRARFAAAAGRGRSGTSDEEALLSTLEYGMPPTAGLRLEVDGLLAVLDGRSIRDIRSIGSVR